MEGKFIVYPLAKTMEKSKSGKFHYWFANGKQNPANGNLFDRCKCFDFWSDKDLQFSFMKPIEAILDVDGDFVKLISIVEETKK